MRNLSITVEMLETTLYADFKEILLINLPKKKKKKATHQHLEYILRNHCKMLYTSSSQPVARSLRIHVVSKQALLLQPAFGSI